MKKTTTISLLLAAAFGLASTASAQVVYTQFFGAPAGGDTLLTVDSAGASDTLGSNGETASTYTYETWLFSNGNGGINQAGAGLADGTVGNPISSLGLARPQDIRGSNSRAIPVVFEASNFSNGVEYTISFDVIGDPDAGNANGKYWLAELYGYDTGGSNYIQIDGTHGGWKPASALVFAANGSATVNWLAGEPQDTAGDAKWEVNGVDFVATANTTVSFNFTYDSTNSPDIGFAVGTFNNVYGIDNFTITAVPEPATFALLAGITTLGLVMYRRRRA
jgi:hypothetical protein